MVETSGNTEYQAYVGPGRQYDVMGATQFSLLYALGIRADSRLLDIGCGSLRAGRFFMVYLEPDHYVGLEPNSWLIDEALDKEIGRGIVALKEPKFVHNDSFDVSGLGSFDFVVAQSIASHTGPTMTRALLRSVRTALAPEGTAAITFMHGWGDNSNEGWTYPRCVRYRKQTILRWMGEAGLHGTPIPWAHPRQTWWIVAREDQKLPPWHFRAQLRGSTLSRNMTIRQWPGWLPRRARQLVRAAIK